MQVGSAWIDIDGDLKPFDRTVGNAQKRMRSRFSAVGKTAALGFGAGLVGAGVAMKGFLEAQIESEKSSARMRAQLKASGKSFARHGDQIDRVIQKQSRLAGLDDEDLQDAFTNIVRTTGDVGKSLKLVGLASDFARAKHMDVAKAGELVAKVAGGNTGILSRYGIVLKDGATATEALAALQQRFAGQAQAYGKTTAGSVDRLNVAWENVQETLGAAIAPAFERIVTGAGEIVSEIDRIAQRDDIDLSDKIRLSADVLKQRFRPIAREARQALSDAAPEIQSAAGTLARKAAGAFVKAWLASDWWVKLATVGFLVGKMGGFGAVGGIMAGRFARRFRGDLAKSPEFDAAGRSAGRKWAKSFGKVAAPIAIGAILPELSAAALRKLAGIKTPDMKDILESVPGSKAEADKAKRDYWKTNPPRNPEATGRRMTKPITVGRGGGLLPRGGVLPRGYSSSLSVAAAPRLDTGILRSLGTADGGEGGFTGQLYGDVHNHFTTPSGDAPDAAYAAAQIEKELRRRGRG